MLTKVCQSTLIMFRSYLDKASSHMLIFQAVVALILTRKAKDRNISQNDLAKLNSRTDKWLLLKFESVIY